ncbi:MAG: EI24 domain-containing protein [Deltaproteobacteria bacterium]|nr:EI24 domain-containing protein [Deltaproteobacteria bacterium]
MFGIIEGFWRGFWAPLQALKMIVTSPRLLSLVAVPLAVNIGIYLLFFHYAAHYLDDGIAAWGVRMAQAVPHWLLSVSVFALKILSWLALALVAALTFTFVSGLIAAPFNDALSKAAMRLRLKETGAHFAVPEVRHPISTTVWLELKRISILVVGALVALILGLIPLLQLPALALGALIVSFEYFGYPISHRSSSLTPVAYFTVRHPAVSLGFGSFLLLIMALPFTSLVYIPLAVVGGTMLYADLAAKTPSAMTVAADKRKRT